MVEKKTFLRVLYTINSSPQYILARSYTPIPITLVPPTEFAANPSSPHDAQPLYATVCLKTCLQTICRSSPELTQDISRDFSIYVLDPLESNSIPPLNISSRDGNPQPSTGTTPSGQRGMAVGLGLMSWALAADESDAVTVAGTLMKRGTTQEALEVIFALRETTAMKQPAWNSSVTLSQSSDVKRNLSSNQDTHLAAGQASLSSTSASYSFSSNTRETLASIHLRTKTKVKPLKPIKQSTTPVTESDKLLNAETYIGPLKKKGRPRASGSESKSLSSDANAVASSSCSSGTQEVIVIDGSDSDGSHATPIANTFQIDSAVEKPLTEQGSKVKRKRPTRHPTTPPFSTGPLIRRSTMPVLPTAPTVQPKVESEKPNLLDLLAYISVTSPSSEPHAQNAAILAAINAIDSPENTTEPTLNNSPSPALLSALKQLLTLYAKPATSNHPLTVQQSTHGQSSSQDDGIIILDKENVNPTVFRKGSQKETSSKKNQHSAQSPSTSRASGHNSPSERSIQSLGISSCSKENASSTPSLKETVSTLTASRIVRKRTLSDFMDEKESRSRDKGKERKRGEKLDAHIQRGQRSSSMSSDALRHYPRLVDQPRSEPGTNSYYRTGMEPWTSPPRPTVNSTSLVHSRHTDENAFTSRIRTEPASPKIQISASSPSRSHSNRQGVRRKYVVPEWARTSTATQPRLSEEAQRALEEAEERKKQERLINRRKLMQSKPKRKNGAMTSEDQPKIQQSMLELPIRGCDEDNSPVAARSDRPVFAAADICFPILSSSRPSSPTPNQMSIPKTPKTPARNKSNFIPTSGEEQESLFTPIMNSGSLFGSALSSRSTATLPILTSPLGNRKKGKRSPSALACSGRVLYLSPRTPVPASESSGLSKKSEDDETWKQTLAEELENTLDDLDGPPSSLMSDMEVEQVQPEPSASAGIDPEDDMDIMPVKQHWAGLPPSSPPAPSSPLLMPEADDTEIPGYDEMDDIPIATSDSEVDTDMDVPNSLAPSPAMDSLPVDDHISHEDLSNLVAESSPRSMELFEQFTNLNARSDDLPSFGGSCSTVDPSMEAMFQNGLDGIDFTEFWETFKPLVNDNTTDAKNIHSFGSVDEHMVASLDELDHTKLASEIQALFSGCLM